MNIKLHGPIRQHCRNDFCMALTLAVFAIELWVLCPAARWHWWGATVSDV